MPDFPSHHREREVTEYVEAEAPGEKATRAEFIREERVGERTHEIWDVQTDQDRYWVITNLTNLYSQRDHPSADQTLTFHVGLMVRMATVRRAPASEEELYYLTATWRKWEQAAEALDLAKEPEEFQAVGMRCREALLELSRQLADEIDVDDPPKKGDFIAWSGLAAATFAPGPSGERIRAYARDVAEAAWQLVSWLTHAQNAVRQDAELAIHSTAHTIVVVALGLVRKKSGAPERCPHCGSYRIFRDYRPELPLEPPFVTLCERCGWTDEPSQGPPASAGALDGPPSS